MPPPFSTPVRNFWSTPITTRIRLRRSTKRRCRPSGHILIPAAARTPNSASYTSLGSSEFTRAYQKTISDQLLVRSRKRDLDATRHGSCRDGKCLLRMPPERASSAVTPYNIWPVWRIRQVARMGQGLSRSKSSSASRRFGGAAAGVAVRSLLRKTSRLS